MPEGGLSVYGDDADDLMLAVTLNTANWDAEDEAENVGPVLALPATPD